MRWRSVIHTSVSSHFRPPVPSSHACISDPCLHVGSAERLTLLLSCLLFPRSTTRVRLRCSLLPRPGPSLHELALELTAGHSELTSLAFAVPSSAVGSSPIITTISPSPSWPAASSCRRSLTRRGSRRRRRDARWWSFWSVRFHSHVELRRADSRLFVACALFSVRSGNSRVHPPPGPSLDPHFLRL